MKFKLLLIFLILVSCRAVAYSENRIKDNWETIEHDGFSWGDYDFGEKNEILVLLFRARDCAACIQKVIRKMNLDKKKFIAIAGYMKESELFSLRIMNKQCRHITLLDRSFSLIRKLRIRRTPVILKVDRNLQYCIAGADISKRYLDEE